MLAVELERLDESLHDHYLRPVEALDRHPLSDRSLRAAITGAQPRMVTYITEYNRRLATPQRVGLYEFDHAQVFGQWGLIVLPEKSATPCLWPGMGWGASHLDEVLQPDRWDTQRHMRTVETAVLLSFPGALTFGHWLSDILIRLQLFQSLQASAGASFIVPGVLPEWAYPILVAGGVTADRLLQVQETEGLQVGRLIVPTITGHNGVLNQFLAAPAFRRAQLTAAAFLTPMPPKRILVPLHTTQSSIHAPRTCLNRVELIEGLAAKFPIEVIDPTAMGLPKQIALFRSADIVVGEDSSALHNVMWSDRANLVVFSSPSRANFFHAGIQDARGRGLEMIWGETASNDGGFVIPLADLIEAVERASSDPLG